MKLLVLDGNSLLNRAFFGIKLLSTKSGGSDGGSSVLTPKSRDYLKRYLAMEQEVQQAAKALFQKYFADLP